jgi:hypothetical protein
LDCLQSGSSMQYFSRSVFSNEYLISPSLASSFVSLNLTYKVGPLIIIVIRYDSYLSLILMVVCKLMKPPLVNWNWCGSNWPKNAWCCDCDEPLLWKYPNFYWKFVQIKVISNLFSKKQNKTFRNKFFFRFDKFSNNFLTFFRRSIDIF